MWLRIRLTDNVRALFVDDAPDGWLAMLEATLAYGVSRQTIMQRVKRGELKAVCGSPEIVEGFLCRFRLGLGFPDLVVDG